MTPDAPDAMDAERLNGAPLALSRCDAAWRNLVNAMISEAHHLAIAVVDDTAMAARRHVSRISDHAVRQPSVAAAVTLGATIGIIGAVLLKPRTAHEPG